MRKFSLLLILLFLGEITWASANEIFASRENAITRVSASASPSVVSINVTEVKRVY